MINIYAPVATDWASNGLAILLPTECKISETAGGSYELELTHPITDDLRWKTIAEGCVIKAPVPASETPAINLVKAGIPGVPGIPAVPAVPERIIYIANTLASVYVQERPSFDSRKLRYIRNLSEYEYLGPYDADWHRAVSADGYTGYINNHHGVYARTEAAKGAIPAKPGKPAVPGYSTVVGPRQIRDQFFRIYHVEQDTAGNTVKAWARHISYDLMANICGNLKLKKVPMPIALTTLKSSLINPDDRELVTNMTKSISGEWQYENGIKVLLDPEEGFVSKARCKIIRDNNDIFLLENVAYDRNVRVEYGKNLNGIKWTKRSDAVVTRIVPVGRKADNTNLLLPETYIDSEYISIYPVVYTQKLDVPDAKVSDTMTTAQAYTAMRNAAAAEFAKGCDLISFDLDVDFIQLGDTEEYKQYHDLQQVFLYDTITINHSPTGFSARAQVKAYEWDAILNKYTKVTLGDVFEARGSTVAGYQLPTGGISGTKLVPGGVGSDQLRSLSVLSAHIGLAEIKTANLGLAIIEKGHMKEATIDSLVADSIEAVRAHIQQLVADEVTADELYANLATIALAQITTANIENANIEWANIETLKAAVIDVVRARIEYLIANELVTDELYAALAEIATAEIGTANIDWANIKDLVSGRAIFTQGLAGQMYIADLAVTEANMVSLTVGELIVRGADGLFYAVSVDSEGEITTTLKQVNDGDIEDESITGSTKIISGSVTADRLNATDIFADNAIIRQLMAANLDVDIFFAREGVINKLTLDYVQPLNDAITVLGGNLSETNESIDQIISANATKQSDVDTQIANLNLALASLNTGVDENNTSTQGAIDAIQSMIEALEAQRTELSGKIDDLEQAKIETDNYIQIGTVKLSNGTTVFGVAVGKDVDVLNPDGTISTFERSMTATTANEFMILTGGDVVGVFDATGMTSESVKVNKIVMGNRFAWSMTPSNAMVLKKG